MPLQLNQNNSIWVELEEKYFIDHNIFWVISQLSVVTRYIIMHYDLFLYPFSEILYRLCRRETYVYRFQACNSLINKNSLSIIWTTSNCIGFFLSIIAKSFPCNEIELCTSLNQTTIVWPNCSHHLNLLLQHDTYLFHVISVTSFSYSLIPIKITLFHKARYSWK